MRAKSAFTAILALNPATLLDIGCGNGDHAKGFAAHGIEVTTISLRAPSSIIGNYNTHDFGRQFDCLWASHVLEHQPDCGAFLRKCYDDLKYDGIFAVTVPPRKDSIVGGHVSLWNAGLLLYRLILAGFDCSQASVLTDGYDISVIVRKRGANLPQLAMDAGDIERLAQFFPMPVKQDFNGNIDRINWQWQ